MFAKGLVSNFKAVTSSYTCPLTLFTIFAFLFFLPVDALAYTPQYNAGADDVIGSVLCVIYKQMTGVAGKTVGCIAVVFTSLGALFGKTSWSLVLIVVVSIGCALGATNIVGIIVTSVGGVADPALCGG